MMNPECGPPKARRNHNSQREQLCYWLVKFQGIAILYAEALQVIGKRKLHHGDRNAEINRGSN